jgi:hypothetical protein
MVSCSTPITTPLSINTASAASITASAKVSLRYSDLDLLTEWIKAQRNVNAFLNHLIDLHLIDGRRSSTFHGQRVEPDANTRPIISPKRIFQGAYSTEVNPAEFYSVSKYLHVISNFFRANLTGGLD